MLTQIGINAKKAERVLMTAPLVTRDNALAGIASALRENSDYIIDENKKDIEEISAEYLKGLSFHYVTDIQDVLDVALLQEEVKNPIKFTFEEERKEK